jgi:FkbM family methyltransferase
MASLSSAFATARSYARLLTHSPARSARTWKGLRRWFRRPLRLVAHGLRRGPPTVMTSTTVDGQVVAYRTSTADLKVLHEVFVEDAYRLDAMPARLGVVLDVGAHIGLFSLRVAPRADRVLAFEPHPENAALLRRNLAGPAFAHVEGNEVAVAGGAGTVRLFSGGRNTAGHTIAPKAPSASLPYVDVPCVALADALEAARVERVGLAKIDCEGAEYAAVESLRAWGLSRVARLAIEYHAAPPGAPAAHSGEGLEALLRAEGFAVERVPLAHEGYGLLHATREGSGQ